MLLAPIGSNLARYSLLAYASWLLEGLISHVDSLLACAPGGLILHVDSQLACASWLLEGLILHVDSLLAFAPSSYRV